MTAILRPLLSAGVAALALSGCGLLKESVKTTPVLGDRVAVLTAETEIGIDATTAALPFSVPAPAVNADWGQSGGNAQKSMGHVALGDTLGLAWSRSIGEGSSESARLTAAPIVTGGKVFTIDTQAVVRSFEAASGAPGWSTAVTGTEGEVVDRAALYGGGLASGAGRLYATNGLGHVTALSPENGAIIWTAKPLGPLRGAPSFANGSVYVMTQDNQLAALDAATGATQWTAAAAMEIAGVFGAASPAVGRGTVIAGYSSGELSAYRYENGRGVWQDNLTRTRISTSVSSLSDIDADPVIDGNQVIAIGQGGRMVALDILSGQRMWELSIAGMSTPWVAGDWVFVVTDQGQALSINRTSGRVRWINQMPRFGNEKKRKDPIFYEGPVLAGGRLIFLGSNGAMIEIDPDSGAFLNQRSIGDAVTLQPVVANQTLYLITDSGQLQAYR